MYNCFMGRFAFLALVLLCGCESLAKSQATKVLFQKMKMKKREKEKEGRKEKKKYKNV